MEEKEYLQTLGEQILNPHARTHVLEEIQEHIDEQMQDYIDTGMSPDAAEKQMPEPAAIQNHWCGLGSPRKTGVTAHAARQWFSILFSGWSIAAVHRTVDTADTDNS